MFDLDGRAVGQDKSTTEKKSGSVSGVVVKEPGSQPLKKASITLVAESQTEGGNYAAITDATGHFSIEEVRPGRYWMMLERTGYVEISERQRRWMVARSQCRLAKN